MPNLISLGEAIVRKYGKEYAERLLHDVTKEISCKDKPAKVMKSQKRPKGEGPFCWHCHGPCMMRPDRWVKQETLRDK
jgi:hypothetical protein